MWHEIQCSGPTEITFPVTVERNNQSNHLWQGWLDLNRIYSHNFLDERAPRMPPHAGGRHTLSGGWATLRTRRVADIMISHVVPFPLCGCAEQVSYFRSRKKWISVVFFPSFIKCGAPNLKVLPCGDKTSRGAPHRSYQDGQARGQRIYSFECSTPGRAHGRHAVILGGRVRTPGYTGYL